ncbi:MAG: conjugative transposon protein TraM [Prevotellaceae bacterium]|jgi:hypothetical protein|nr:conjugative transposon protein TraM [Prevotellaceae bacterium]
MALNRKQAITLAGGVAGGALVIAIIIGLISALVSGVSESSDSASSEDSKLQFSVVQRQDEPPAPPQGSDFERRTAAYAAGEKRLEQENTYVSSTSFGSGFKRAEEEEAKAAADGQEGEHAPAAPPPAPPKHKVKKHVAVAQAAAQAAIPPPPQEIRAKRTRYAAAEAAPAAVQGEPQAQLQARTQAQAAQKISFRAKIFEDVEVINSAYVKIRVLQDFEYEGCTVRRNAMLTAEARRGSRSVEILLYSLMACGRRMNVSFTAYSLDGIQGLPVREDNAAEVGAKEGKSEAITGAASGVASRASGVMGIIGSAVAAGVSGGTRASQQAQPVLVEEGREVIFMMN